jgi:hypothetical protein
MVSIPENSILGNWRRWMRYDLETKMAWRVQIGVALKT